jgi:hypothetical protein
MEMEKRILQMMELMLARQEAAAARQEKRNAEAKARHERFLAFLDGLTPYGEGRTTCQTETTLSSEEMEATNLEATSEATEAPVERQDLFKEEINVDNIGSSEDWCGEQRLCHVAEGLRSGPKTVFPGRRSLLPASESYAAPSLQFKREINIRKGPGKDGSARGAPKGRRLQKTHRISPECSVGIRNRGPKDHLHLWMKRTSDRIIRRTNELTSLFDLLSQYDKLMRTHFGRSGHRPSARRMC